MIRRSRPFVALLVLVAMSLALLSSGTQAAGAAAERQTWRWERQLAFARALAVSGYPDLADRVVARLDADETIVGIERAILDRRIGDHLRDLAETLAASHDAEGFRRRLDQAAERYRRYLDYPAVRDKEEYAAERFETRLSLGRFTLARAQALARLLDGKRTADAEKPRLRQQAAALHQAAIAELGRAAADKAREVEHIRRLDPRGDDALRRRWQQRLREARAELFRARLEQNVARFHFAEFLEAAGAPAKERLAQLDAAEKDYRQLRLDFAGHPGAVQANLELARCLIEKGSKHHGEALERLGEVWARRDGYRRLNRIPAEAAELRATVLLVQKKPAQAVAAIDELLAFATDGAWDPEQRSATAVATLLADLPETDRDALDRRAAVRVLMLQAEALARQGAQAKAAKRPAAEVRRAYAAACATTTGVLRVQQVVPTRYTPLLRRWLGEARLPPPPELLWQEYASDLERGDYASAAGRLQQIAAQQTLLGRQELPPAEKRDLWLNIARCYHAAGQGREATYAFIAVARWFPTSQDQTHDAVRAAVAAAHAQHQRSKSAFDRRLVEWAQEQVALIADPAFEGVVHIRKGLRLRDDGKLGRALDEFRQVAPGDRVHPQALYHIAATWQARLAALAPAQQRGPDGRAAIEAMERAFAALYGLHRARYPKLRQEGREDECRPLAETVAAALVAQTAFHLNELGAGPERVLELTADLPRRYEGAEGASAFPLVLYQRMRAAYGLLPDAPLDRIDRLVAVLDEAWSAIRRHEGFAHRDKAAALGARACLIAAGRLEAQDAARSERLRDRSLDFELDLIRLAPDQPAGTCHRVIHRLRTRVHEPKSEDWRTIVAVAPAAVERLRGEPRAAPILLDIRLALAVAHASLGDAREAIRILEPIDDAMEGACQKQLDEFRKQLDDWERRQRRGPRPERPPRAARHYQVKRVLADSYLAARTAPRYERALNAYALLTRVYASRPEDYAPASHGLCEALVRLGRYEEAARTIDRALRKPPPYHGGEAGRRRLRQLVVRMKAAVPKLPDARRRAELAPFLDQILARQPKQAPL